MSSTSISSLPAEVPESVCKAVEAFGQGKLSLLEVRQAVATALEKNPVVAEPIHELLDEALKNRALSIAEYGELVSAVGAVVSENIPTEWSEDAHEESGVFRVVDEGTLVPADLSEWPEFQTHAGNESAEVEQHTRPYGLEVVKEAGTGPAAANEDEPAASADAADDIVPAGPGSVLRERFRLEEEVARGAMGVVYRATDLMKLDAGAADPQVAVKLVSPDIAGDSQALRSFQNEFVSTQHLSHPNIIRVFELDRDAEQYFITMEWLEGQSLASLLDNSQGSALQPTQTYAIIEQLCDALVYAHEHNVVHADVKPGNVFLLDSGEVKLIDFGIARCEGDLADQTSDASGDAVALTPAYASCERLEQRRPSPQDDLYSLASLIYRLLAGRRVFGPLTALEAEAQQAEAVRIGSMDERRWNALLKALAFRAENRHASVSAFVDEFGRRGHPRDEIAGDSVATVADETAQMPVLDAVPETETEIDLPDDMEVDFPFDETAAEAPEPELSGIFDAAALSGDSEEIVLTSEPEPTPQPIDYPPKAGEATSRKLVSPKIPALGLQPLLARMRQAGPRAKQAAGAALFAVIALVVLVSWPEGDTDVAPARTVAMPELTRPAPASIPAPAPALVLEQQTAPVEPETAPIDSVPTTEAQAVAVAELQAAAEPEQPAAAAEPEIEPEIEPAPVLAAEIAPEPAPAAEPEPAVAAVAESAPAVAPAPVADAVDPEPIADPEPVVAVVAEPEPEPEPEPAVAAEPVVDAVESALPESAPESDPAIEPAPEPEQEEPQLLMATAASGIATVPAAAEIVGPMPVYVPPPPPESVALSDLEFIKYVEPRYPRSSIDRRYEGWVDVEFRVGADGLPQDIRVVGSNLPTKFEGTSVAAVEKWRFEPYLHEGEVIAVNSAVRLRYAN